ncbi:MAG: amino acid ABC transporter permease [Acidimicrobiia bacterium]
MSAGPAFLGDALGPRGRRRVLIASALSGVMLAAAAAWAVNRLADRGQLEARLWSRYLDPGVPGYLWEGLANTLRLALVSMGLALAAGFVLAIGRLARNRILRFAAGAWIEFFRGMPLVLLMLFNLLGAPKLGLDLTPFTAAALALVLYNSAVLAEILRAGILSLEAGQRHAALAVGLSEGQAMRLVIAPQAIRRMVPAMVSQLVTLLKDTSLAAIVTYEELLRRFQLASGATVDLRSTNLQGVVLAAMVFVVVNLCLSLLARRLEVRQRRRYRTGGIAVGGVEELAVLDVAAEAQHPEGRALR